MAKTKNDDKTPTPAPAPFGPQVAAADPVVRRARATGKRAPAKKAANGINNAVRAVKRGDTPPSLTPKAIEKYVAERATVSAQDKQLAADLNRAFANRPVEIAGGLGLLSFEVVRHEEPKWWQRLFSFAHGPTGQTLTSVLGFPAITQPALSLVDELLGRLADDPHEVLFKSAPMRLALSRRAHDDFTGGNARIKLGALDDGYCVLARGRDHDTLVAADPVFHPTHGILAPASANPARIEELTTDNPLHGLTYAVFRVRMKETALDPDFAFRG